ncbi:ribonuclease Z [Eubacterium oxidoreducens]|uniref:Ribonuclease Z n=1 Tax=Eubacterium oxidoreducens TaxID=1732 RepID=A0A1G6CUQ8_EUBOX|nr:ribonuclease Z [Eubacterium oxidoreducens]SDB36544.1 ribonuclease Z [Eubacterium oxidoreducens]
MLDVCLLGTAGMMPLPHRHLTALMTRYNGSNLLIDCGEGTQVAIKKKGWSVHSIDTICFTHYHADHISGLPGLLLSMGNADRTKPLLLVGPKGLCKVVEALRIIAPELPFAIQYHELKEEVEVVESQGYRITAFKVKHNVVCYGYTIDILRAGKFSVENANKHEIPQRCWNRLQKGETVEMDGKVYTPDMVMGAPRRGIKVTYCTDSRPLEIIAKQAYKADLFVCEGMYAEKEKLAKARQYKHMTFYEAAGLAAQAKPKQLWLTHFSPSLVRAESYMDEVRGIFADSHLGKDGKSIELSFAEEE